MSRRSIFLSEKLENTQIFQISLTYSKKEFEKTFWQGFEKCTCTVHSNNLRKTSFFWGSDFFFFLGNWVKTLCLWQKKLGEAVKKSIYVSRRLFCLPENLKNAQMCNFRVLPAKKSLRKLLSRVVKSVLLLSGVTFWGEVVLRTFVFFFFVGNWIKVFCLWQKKLGEAVKKSFCVSRRLFCLPEKLKNAQMCIFCVLPAKRSFRKLLGRSVKVYLYCPE